MGTWLAAICVFVAGLIIWRVMVGVLGFAAWPWLLIALLPIVIVIVRRFRE